MLRRRGERVSQVRVINVAGGAELARPFTPSDPQPQVRQRYVGSILGQQGRHAVLPRRSQLAQASRTVPVG